MSWLDIVHTQSRTCVLEELWILMTDLRVSTLLRYLHTCSFSTWTKHSSLDRSILRRFTRAKHLGMESFSAVLASEQTHGWIAWDLGMAVVSNTSVSRVLDTKEKVSE